MLEKSSIQSAWRIHQNQDRKKKLPSEITLQHLLLIAVDITLSGKGKTFKGPRSLVAQQSIKLRGSKLISGTRIFPI